MRVLPPVILCTTLAFLLLLTAGVTPLPFLVKMEGSTGCTVVGSESILHWKRGSLLELNILTGPLTNYRSGWWTVHIQFPDNKNYTYLVAGIKGELYGSIGYHDGDFSTNSTMFRDISLLDTYYDVSGRMDFDIYFFFFKFPYITTANNSNLVMDDKDIQITVARNDEQLLTPEKMRSKEMYLAPAQHIDQLKSINFERNGSLDNCNKLPRAVYFLNRRSGTLAIGYTSTSCMNIAVAVLCVILSIVTSKLQPTKSRFLVPYIYAFWFIAHMSLIGATYWFFSLKFSLLALASSTTRVLAHLVYIVYVIRYLNIRNFYRIMKSTSKSGKLPVLTLYKKLVGRIAFIIYTVVLGIILLAILAIVFGVSISANITGEQLSLNFNLGILCVEGLLLLMILTVVTVDVVINSKDIYRRGCGWFLFFDDPLHFRIELMLYLFGGFLQIIFFILTQIDSKIMTYEKGRHSVNLTTYCIIHIGLNYLIFVFVGCGGYTSAVAIWRWIFSPFHSYKELEEPAADNMLTSILTDEAGLALMTEYCEKEFSLENVLLFNDLYPEKVKGFISVGTLEKLYETYVASSAICEVNLSNKCKIAISKQIKDLSTKSKEDFILFDDVIILYREVTMNLSDTLSRFSCTDEYKIYAKQKQTANKLLDNYN